MENTENQGYHFAHGDVWVHLGTQLQHVCGPNDLLGIAFDAESGTIHKRGSYASVSAWLNRTNQKLRESGVPGSLSLSGAMKIVAFPPSPQSLALLNDVMEGRGDGTTLLDRVAAITDAKPSPYPQ